MATMDYEQENGRYDDEPRYERDRSASPRPKRDDNYRRDRSASPNGRMDSRGPPGERNHEDGDSGARNPGSNLFVTGIHPRLSEADVSRLFEKYGEVEGCSIMKDPHTQESRGFGFVKMRTREGADDAMEGLQDEKIEGRNLNVEKARRARPRTPTPGKYFGPPKRGEEDFRGPPRGGRFGGGGGSRGYGGGRYDDSYRATRYDDRRPYRPNDYGSRGIDRYARRDDHYAGRDDRYAGRDDRYSGREDRGSGDDYRGVDPFSRDSERSHAAIRGGRDQDYRSNDRFSRR